MPRSLIIRLPGSLTQQRAENLHAEAKFAPVEVSVLMDGVFVDHFSGMGCWYLLKPFIKG